MPGGGLCNRMRAIASGIDLAEDLGVPLEVLWAENSELNAPFQALFEPIDQIAKIEAPTEKRMKRIVFFRRALHKPQSKGDYAAIAASKLFRPEFTENLFAIEDAAEWAEKKRKKIEIFSCHRFYKRDSDKLRLFRPIASLQRRVEELKSTETVGLHIRRTDSIPSIQESPIELFDEMIEREISEKNEQKFFLATDDPETESRLKEKFSGRIIVQEGKRLDRNDPVAIEDAVVDLYALSRCSKIYGSFWSSYSETAAAIGNISLTVLKQQMKRIAESGG